MSLQTELRNEPRWTRRKDARPEEITAAALELFVERGYAGTRLEDVAARAGVSKGTLYLYFANKAELFKAVVREGLVSPLSEVREMMGRYEGSMMDLLRTVVCGWWERIGSKRVSGIPKLVISEAGNFPEITEFYLAEVVRPGTALLRSIVERGVAEGEFRPIDSAEAVDLIFAPLMMIALWNHSLGAFETQRADPRRLLDTHLDMLRRGLAAEPEPEGVAP
jgi:AcrR family transcriptional regulator